MSDKELLLRLLSFESNLEHSKLEALNLSYEELVNLVKAGAKLVEALEDCSYLDGLLVADE